MIRTIWLPNDIKLKIAYHKNNKNITTVPSTVDNPATVVAEPDVSSEPVLFSVFLSSRANDASAHASL